jgi:multicomponent Na+:H+ antiporter subunit G
MIQAVRPWVADALILFGLLTISIGVYGMVWLPDLYTRLHAASKAVFLGVIPILLAAATSGEIAIISRVILISVFLLLTTPVAAHAIGCAAYVTQEPLKVPDSVDESGHLRAARAPEQRR